MRSLIGLIILFYSISGAGATETEAEAVGGRGPSPVAGLVAAEERLEELRRARRHLDALAAVFPERVEEVAFRGGDWAIRIDGLWFAWAQGRLLPEAEGGRWDEYSPVRFYNYYPGPARLRELPAEREAALRGGLSTIDAQRAPRSPAFADALYDIRSREEAELRMREVSFLGRSTRIHYIAYDALKRVEARIVELAEADPAVREFIDNLSTVHGYNWRNIAGSGSRSYHSYGLAVDLVPRSFSGLPVYWRWASEAGWTDWWRIPVARRWSPPQPVIDAFEGEGFYWGGKWLFFDNIHFEYRPEVFEF
jgi:hypothetical protein